MTTSNDIRSRAEDTAGTAADEGRHVAGVAKGEARQVADEAMNQASNLMHEVTVQAEEQSRAQRDRLVQMLQTAADDLESMAADGKGLASDVVRRVADQAHQLSGRLDGREPRDLLDDVRGFARRRPGAFLLGAVAAGVVAGRLARGAKQAQSGQQSGLSSGPTSGPTSGPGLGSGLAADVTSPGDPFTTGLDAPSSGPSPRTGDSGGTAAGDPLAGVDAPAGPVVTPGTSEGAGTTWSDVRGGGV